MRIGLTLREWLTALFGRPLEPESYAGGYCSGSNSAEPEESRLPDRDEGFYWAWFMHGHC
jgi:hypothetical protein